MKKRVPFLLVFLFLLLSANSIAADEWVSVRSKNFHVIGNASETAIKAVAIKLEQFRHVFGLLFPNIELNDPVETNVIVFKDTKSYLPFLPKLENGRPDKTVAGYFLSDREVNYITLAADGNESETYKIIFHEFIHYLLDNNFKRSEIPVWLTEGLAEYYSTFEIENGQNVVLGNLRKDHLSILAGGELIPLKDFFKIDNIALNKKNSHTRTIFYAQAWVIVHYFTVKDESERLSKFVDLSRERPDSESIFKEAFGMGYADMEAVLRQYAKQKKFTRFVASFKAKISFESDLTYTRLTEFEALGFLGDLLYRNGELQNAESYLEKALAGEPEQVRANISMGLVKLRLKKPVEAKAYFSKAVASGSSNYYAHYGYALLLSRENMSDEGVVRAYEKEDADHMRTLLKKAIELNPGFIESYYLYSLVSIVTNEGLDEAVAYLKTALELQPGNEYVTLSLAQAYILQKKFDEGEAIARTVLNSTFEESLRNHALLVLKVSADHRGYEARRKERMDRFENGNDPDGKETVKRRRLTESEVEAINAERRMSKLNAEIIALKQDEQRAVGYFESTVCKGKRVDYVFSTVDGKTIRLTGVGFQNLELLAIFEMDQKETFGCGFKSSVSRAVINFTTGKSGTGVLTAVTFVPSGFRLKSAEETANDKKVIYFRNPATGEARAFEDYPELKKTFDENDDPGLF